MELVTKLFEKYGSLDAGDITNNQKKELRNLLSSMEKESVTTLEDHETFIKVVRIFRKANAEDAALYGKNFLDTLKSLLSVGEDGVYSNSNHFLYELIQNVDDCDYECVEDCRLDIKFEYHEAVGKIILTYNEKGFTPRDVFGITGIAENNKNVSADKMEIGEKGVGFKSVFGIADRVIIESGMFSFELDKNDFTIPIPKYDGYDPVKGTRMTLMMSEKNASKAFRDIMDKYKDKKSILNQNPILFLNKLTHLRIYFDDFRYIEFDVQRKEPEERNELKIEEDVIISVDMKDHIYGYDHEYATELHCSRYTMPIIYGKKECRSRYGENVLFEERRHNIIAVFPQLTKDMADYKKGLLYSFLPTQIKINAPVVMHVPFKLDSSRGFVDPQGQNLWFTYTLNKVAVFLKKSYIDLAHTVKQDAIYYMPHKYESFFEKDNQKIECLCVDELKSDEFLNEKVFFTTDGSYESCNNVMAFPSELSIDDPLEIYELLKQEKNSLYLQNLQTCSVITALLKQVYMKNCLNKDYFMKKNSIG